MQPLGFSGRGLVISFIAEIAWGQGGRVSLLWCRCSFALTAVFPPSPARVGWQGLTCLAQCGISKYSQQKRTGLGWGVRFLGT